MSGDKSGEGHFVCACARQISTIGVTAVMSLLCAYASVSRQFLFCFVLFWQKNNFVKMAGFEVKCLFVVLVALLIVPHVLTL